MINNLLELLQEEYDFSNEDLQRIWHHEAFEKDRKVKQLTQMMSLNALAKLLRVY